MAILMPFGFGPTCEVTGGRDESAAAVPDPLVAPERVRCRLWSQPAAREDVGSMAGGAGAGPVSVGLRSSSRLLKNYFDPSSWGRGHS
jgi:hypothetical protein